MKKYFAYALTLLAAIFVTACSEDDGPAGYNGKNGVTLAIQGGNSTLIEDGDDVINVSVTLDRSYTTNVQLDILVQGTETNRLVVTPQSVTIAAGSTSATFQVKSAKLGNLTGQLQYTLTCGNLQSDMKMVTPVTINLRPRTGLDDLTAEQLALIESWKNNYGIDVTPWIGQVALSGEVTEPGDGALTAFSEQKVTSLGGKSVITLGEGCTEDKIVLKMVDNPMGLTAFLYDWLRKETVENDEDFTVDEYGSGTVVMPLINWNKDTQETFNVTLDGIEIDLTQSTGDQTYAVNYVKEGTAPVLGLDGNPIDEEEYYYGKESWIPFKYEYTAWTRLLQKVAEGNEDALEYFNTDGTSDPEYYLLNSGVNEDEWEAEENNFYVVPAGSIDFKNGTMSFAFPADHRYAGGYARVNVTYTAN